MKIAELLEAKDPVEIDFDDVNLKWLESHMKRISTDRQEKNGSLSWELDGAVYTAYSNGYVRTSPIIEKGGRKVVGSARVLKRPLTGPLYKGGTPDTLADSLSYLVSYLKKRKKIVVGPSDAAANDGKKTFAKVFGDRRHEEHVKLEDITSEGLVSLYGSPQSVFNNFDCSNNALTDLVGGPEVVPVVYVCVNNKLTTLEGVAWSIGKNFLDCSRNPLEKIAGLPSELVLKQFKCASARLTSFKGLPDGEYTVIDVHGNKKLTSFDGLPSHIDKLDISNGGFETISGLHRRLKHCQTLKVFDNARLTSALLTVLLIPGLKSIEYNSPDWSKRDAKLSTAFRIIYRYIEKGKAGLIDCQNELLDAGFYEEARM